MASKASLMVILIFVPPQSIYKSCSKGRAGSSFLRGKYALQFPSRETKKNQPILKILTSAFTVESLLT